MIGDLQKSQSKPNVFILIVEDDMENYIQIKRLLEDAGYLNAEWKRSGAGTVQFADTLNPAPNLILLDIGLPSEDGYDVLQRLRNNSQYLATRIVAVSGRVSVEELRRARKAGFDGFLGKPLDVIRFPDQIARILNGEAVWEY